MGITDHDRLANFVQTRRAELKLGVEPAAKLAGMSKDTWKRVERGLKVRDTTYASIDQALRWAPGSAASVLRGGDPVSAVEAKADPAVRVTHIPASDLERMAGDAVHRAVIATRGDLTGDEILRLSERVVEELRSRGVI